MTALCRHSDAYVTALCRHILFLRNRKSFSAKKLEQVQENAVKVTAK
jgi:hypothetical protein